MAQSSRMSPIGRRFFSLPPAPNELGTSVQGTEGVLGRAGRVKRSKAANCRQLADGPSLALFLLVTASCKPFHQAVSSARASVARYP